MIRLNDKNGGFNSQRFLMKNEEKITYIIAHTLKIFADYK